MEERWQRQDHAYNREQGWMGNLSGLKYVFPTSAHPSHVWFHTYKSRLRLPTTPTT